MTAVCPQRIIKEAIRLLEECDLPAYEHEARENSLHELDGLEKALYRDGITKIEEFHG